MKLKRNYFNICLVSILVITLIPFILRTSTIFDEDYSLKLISYNFAHIIKYDSLDVHPPLFYFIIKIFLNITTYWTNSFLIKIIFLRLFEASISIITCVYLIKIVNILGIRMNYFIQIILFLMIPGVISLTYEFIKIRMYSLGALFVVISIYELLRYKEHKDNIHLIIFTLMNVLSLYTNYYVGIISGLITLLYMIIYLFNGNKTWRKMLLSIILMIISFVPWLPIFLKQLSLQNTHPQGASPKQWIGTIILITIFMYPLLWSSKHLNSFLYKTFLNMFIVNICLLFFMAIVSIIDQPVLNFRYFYPVFIVYGFIGINVLYIMFKDFNIRLIPGVLLIILCFSLIGAYVDQMYYYGKSSIQITREFHRWQNTPKQIIHLRNINNSDQNFDMEKIMYLSKNHKYIKAKDVNNVNWIEIEPAYKFLFKLENKHIINY